MDAWKNQLYFGDNLDILRSGRIAVDSVDLIYLDPPFNSNATYNILFAEKSGEKSAAQITAFEDTWHWGEEAAAAYDDIMKHGPRKLADLLQALRAFLGGNDMMAYLTMMAVRLVELHRVLKPTGSLYLHCDPTASHFLKILMDGIFGPRNFCNEIIWHYRKWPAGKYIFQKNHDVILFYSQSYSKERTFNQLFMERTESTLKRFGTAKIVSGYDDKGKRIPSKTENQDSLGVRQDDVWNIGRVPPIKQLFPTQKPEALLERIINASSHEGDIVLDPFCGCGTTVTVAERLKRHWIGIDITHLAITLIKKRLHDTYGPELAPFEVIGEPADAMSAAALAEVNRHQFEWWALGLVDAAPAQDKKKGADKGVDGVLYFQEKDDGPYHKIIVQVKSGHVSAREVRDLKGVLEREKAAIGCLLTLKPPTRPMKEEGAAAGFYTPAQFPESRFPRLQIITIAELFAGQRLEYPRWVPPKTFKKAARRRKGPAPEDKQGELL